MKSKFQLIALAAVFALQSANMASASNREDCLQDHDQALAARACPLYQAEVAAARQQAPAAAPAESAAAPVADAPISRGWLLNPANSKLSLTSVKQVTTTETHFFKTLGGSVSPSGSAVVTVDLGSLETNVDIRNVRMRFLFFETFKYPTATLSAQLDLAKFEAMAVGDTVAYAQTVTVDLHGVKKDLNVDLVATRLSDNEVEVVSGTPVTVQAADFSLTDGVNNLKEAANGIEIVPSATIAFDLRFEGGAANAELQAARAASEQSQMQENTRPLTVEECENRMVVISDTRQIYFASGSAQVDEAESAPVLNEVAQFFNRCPSVTMQIAGHTDSVGGDSYNQALSERRAAAVLSALTARNIDSARVSAAGFGESQPVADNATAAGRAKNRRIEFKRPGG